MPHDYGDVIQTESDRIVAAVQEWRDGPVPWCGAWTVQDVAQHVGGAHHVVAKVIAGRPTTTFSVFRELAPPSADDPGLGRWLSDGTAALIEQLRTLDPDVETWSWWPTGRNVGFWARRMAQETIVHRWDAERGAGMVVARMDPAIAADGIDEYLDVFVALTRHLNTTPGSGESAQITSTDTAHRWSITFSEPGQSELTRDSDDGKVSFVGPAEGLLLLLWGRLDEREAGVAVVGDTSMWNRWRDLVPAM